MQRADSFEKTLVLERLRAGGEGGDRGRDGWMASLTQWTWAWVDSGSWWWTGRPGVLKFMWRIRHDWATELKWTLHISNISRMTIYSLVYSSTNLNQSMKGTATHQHSSLENSRNCVVHGVAKNWTQLGDFHFQLSFHTVRGFSIVNEAEEFFFFFFWNSLALSMIQWSSVRNQIINFGKTKVKISVFEMRKNFHIHYIFTTLLLDYSLILKFFNLTQK